ncbi:MAG: hypothetical protein FWD87_10450 [Spirochaetaceae bacterium]|nr:hypothetical protein [Spirochaetaceae bacterium]
MQKYFIVKTKCGHVGKNMYVPVEFAIYAKNGKEAAFIARQKPGVKRNHPDAILSVEEISREEYCKSRQLFINDLYWRKGAMNVKDNQALLLSRLEPETPHHHTVHKLAVSQQKIEKNNKIATRKFRYRKACQYERFLRNDIALEYGILV